jgi:hypothetical protein
MSDGDRVGSLRRERISPASILLAVLREYSRDRNAVLCFFEGRDALYYDVRIRSELSGFYLVYMNCGGKPNLRRVYLTITTNTSLLDACVIFFFDRDYDHELEGLDCERCFITEGYSIENYYVSPQAFDRILRSAFFMDQVYSEADQQCLTIITTAYQRLQCDFHKELLLFNAWALAQRRRDLAAPGRRISLSVFDGHRLFTLDLEHVKAQYTLEELNARFPECPTQNRIGSIRHALVA